MTTTPVITKSFQSHKFTQWMVAIVAGLTAMTIGQGLSWPLAALPKMKAGEVDFVLSTEESSWMVTVVFLANIISPIPSGYLMNWLGRKRSLQALSTFAVASWVLVYSCHSFWGLCAARALLGAWSGVIYTIYPVYLGESLEPKIRGPAMSSAAFLFYGGILLETLIGLYLTYDYLAIANGVIPFAFFLATFCIPESPYYLLMCGRRAEAEKCLAWLRAPPDVVPELERIEKAVAEQTRPSFSEIFRSPVIRKAFLIVEVLRIVQASSGQSILSSYVSITIPPSFVSPESSTTIITFAWFVFTMVGIWTLETFGRKPMLLFSCTGSFVSMAGITVWYYLRDMTFVDLSCTQWFPLVFLVIHGFFLALGMTSVPTVIQGEVFPIHIKGLASALAAITMAVSSSVVVWIYLPLMEFVGVYCNFLICSVSAFIGIIFIYFIVIETKGKTLEEIQNSLQAKGLKLQVEISCESREAKSS